MTPDQDAHGDTVDFVDEAVTDPFKGIVTKQTPRDESGFAVNVLPGGSPPGFVEAVVDWFDDRYDVDRFDDGEPVGVVLVDGDDPSVVFPIGMWDSVAFPHEPGNGDLAYGGVAVVGRSSGTLRVRGVGAVDVEPEDVVEVTERYDQDDD